MKKVEYDKSKSKLCIQTHDGDNHYFSLKKGIDELKDSWYSINTNLAVNVYFVEDHNKYYARAYKVTESGHYLTKELEIVKFV